MPVKAIHTFCQDEATRIYAWARYVFWAEVEGQQYETYEQAEDESPLGVGTVLMLHFYSALWVAIEAWRKCPLTDETIDELLTDPAFDQNVQLLRRFRNGVYHYQPDLLNERVLAFLREGEHAVTWAFLLHDEFKRVVWEMAHPPGISPKSQDELADAIHGIVGWLPANIVEAVPQRAGKQYRETTEMIMKSGGRNTAEAKELLAAVNHVRSVAPEVSSDWSRQKRAMIEALKRQKRASPTGAT